MRPFLLLWRHTTTLSDKTVILELPIGHLELPSATCFTSPGGGRLRVLVYRYISPHGSIGASQLRVRVGNGWPSRGGDVSRSRDPGTGTPYYEASWIRLRRSTNVVYMYSVGGTAQIIPRLLYVLYTYLRLLYRVRRFEPLTHESRLRLIPTTRPLISTPTYPSVPPSPFPRGPACVKTTPSKRRTRAGLCRKQVDQHT